MDPVRDRGRTEGEENTPHDPVFNSSTDSSLEPSQPRTVSNGVDPQKKPQAAGLFGYTLFALGIALFIRFFIATPYVVDGASMEPTFHNWEYLIVDKVVYDIAEPERGDVIVFTLPADQSRSLIKRVIGLPGETVSIANAKVTIFNDQNPNGFALAEPYVNQKNSSRGEYMEITLGENEYFVLGDNRNVSSDSRVWGTLPRQNVTGRVDVRLFPVQEIDLLPGKARYIDGDITSSEN